MNQYSHRRFLKGLQETRKKTWNSFPDSCGTRKRGALSNISHSRPIVAGNPNVEMSQISQLSMDSSLRTYSQSSNFVDVPLGQPSASSGSHNSHSHSSFSSVDEQLRHSSYPDKPFYLSEYPNSWTRSSMGAQLPDVIGKARSSLRMGSIESSFRAKKREKAKKTRFASFGDTPSVIDRLKRNRYLHNAPSSNSSSRSCGSHCTTQSGHRVQTQHPTTTTCGEVASRSSPYHPQKQPQKDHIEISNHSVHDHDLDVNSRAPKQINRNFRRNNNSKTQQHTSSNALLNYIFAKTATPRKKLNIRYPSLQVQPRHQNQGQGPQEVEKKTQESVNNTKNKMVISRMELDERFCDEAETCTSLNNDIDHYDDDKTPSSIKGANKRSAVSQEAKNDKEQTDAQSRVPLLGEGLKSGPNSKYYIINVYAPYETVSCAKKSLS